MRGDTRGEVSDAEVGADRARIKSSRPTLPLLSSRSISVLFDFPRLPSRLRRMRCSCSTLGERSSLNHPIRSDHRTSANGKKKGPSGLGADKS